ncbi:MAG: Extracellular solute-binding protein family 5 [Candidatus Amesbacteria bacterium GW2011_GWB1_48_13]|uniref:Extracellular solute-binding protein family 5 n=1 Tax=Candidatus Amesbacteria bacterium GW2011_GWB1_48_13 TaxID=1618362 RepID=A0A0G1URI2_9BACT|nr:MAG: Extracellular solute-binding protein family 5 [Candidatus Amesbacteria bacterium GW2011_GWB1_48_13]
MKKYTYDLPRAQELLSKVEKLPDNLVLSTVPTYLPEAEQLKKDWGQLGIKVSIQVTPDIPDEFQALLVAQAVPSDPDQYNLWHSTKDDTNLTNLKNPRIDKLLEDGRKIIDLRERLAIYQDFQKFLLDEAPAIFLYYPQSYLISRK